MTQDSPSLKKQHVDVNLFFKKLIEAIGFETILLHEYKENEERIGSIKYDEEGNEIGEPLKTVINKTNLK